MDTQLRFIRSVPCPDKSEQDVQIVATIVPAGVEVAVGDKVIAVATWQHLEDVEVLADVFWMQPVWVFRNVIELLAKAKNAQGLV